MLAVPKEQVLDFYLVIKVTLRDSRKQSGDRNMKVWRNKHTLEDMSWWVRNVLKLAYKLYVSADTALREMGQSAAVLIISANTTRQE